MAEFKQWSERETNAGPGRIALTDAALTPGTDPAAAADFMDTGYVFQTPWKDKGSPEAEITVTRTFEEQAYRVALSDGDFGATPTAFSMAVACNLAQVADFNAFKLAWFITSAITQVVTTDEQVLGLDAPRSKVYRSLVLVTIDYLAAFLRFFYLRKVSNVAGDSAMVLNDAALQVLPLNLRAFPDTTATGGKIFGFIMQQDGFGGIVFP